MHSKGHSCFGKFYLLALFFFFNLIFSIKLGKIKEVKNPLNNLTFIHYSVDAILGRHA